MIRFFAVLIGILIAITAQAQPDLLWSQIYGGDSSETCRSITQTADGGFALAGGTGVWYEGDGDFWLVRTDDEGEELWSQTYGGEAMEECLSGIHTTDGGFALAGYTHSLDEGNDDFWLVKTEPDPVSVPRIVDPALPNDLTLMPPYPNPFNATTQVRFGLPKRSAVRINVLDLYGRTVATFADRTYETGFHSVTWDATAFPTGLYLVRLEAGGVSRSVKTTLIK